MRSHFSLQKGRKTYPKVMVQMIMLCTAGCTTVARIGRAHCMYVCMVITYSKSMDQPDKVANHARGQLNRENIYSPVCVRA